VGIRILNPRQTTFRVIFFIFYFSLAEATASTSDMTDVTKSEPMAEDQTQDPTKELLDKYAKAKNDYQAARRERALMSGHPDFKEANKQMKDSKTEMDQCKEAILELVMKRESVRPGTSKQPETKRKRPSKWGPPVEDSATLNQPVVDAAELQFR
jgi:hypothetical protein